MRPHTSQRQTSAALRVAPGRRQLATVFAVNAASPSLLLSVSLGGALISMHVCDFLISCSFGLYGLYRWPMLLLLLLRWLQSFQSLIARVCSICVALEINSKIRVDFLSQKVC